MERCPNNQPLVICNKEEISATLPHTIHLHTVALFSLDFSCTKGLSFGHQSDLFSASIPSHKVLGLNRQKVIEFGQETMSSKLLGLYRNSCRQPPDFCTRYLMEIIRFFCRILHTQGEKIWCLKSGLGVGLFWRMEGRSFIQLGLFFLMTDLNQFKSQPILIILVIDQIQIDKNLNLIWSSNYLDQMLLNQRSLSPFGLSLDA